jgi:hypothetical protein
MNDYSIGTEVYVQGTEWTNACASTFYRGIVVSKRVGGWMDVVFDDNDTFPFRASKLDEHAHNHSLHCTETLLSAAAFLDDVATLDGAASLLSLSSTVYVMPKPGRGKGLMGSAQTFVRSPLKDAKSRPVLKQIN